MPTEQLPCLLHVSMCIQAPPKVLSDAGVELGINYPYPVVTPEESAQRVEYACEVIASCCPAPPKYKEEPYYPPSDPCLASDAVCRPWSSSLPGVSRHMYGQVSICLQLRIVACQKNALVQFAPTARVLLIENLPPCSTRRCVLDQRTSGATFSACPLLELLLSHRQSAASGMTLWSSTYTRQSTLSRSTTGNPRC